MKEASIQAVGVVGLGLIGSSILKDVRKHAPQIARFGISRGSEANIALHEQLIQPTASLKDMVNSCDLIFIATPIESVATIAEEITSLKTSKKHLIVADVASVKTEIALLFTKLSRKDISFVPSHPMGGSERSGYRAARGGLFRQKPWIICLDEGDLHIDAAQSLAKFLETCCGVRIILLPPKTHDTYTASISHLVLGLSHLLFDFVNEKHPEALKIAGESFITTTRLASDNPDMLANIYKHNGNNIGPIIDEFLQFITNKTRDLTTFNLEYFNNNKITRDSWIHHRNKE